MFPFIVSRCDALRPPLSAVCVPLGGSVTPTTAGPGPPPPPQQNTFSFITSFDFYTFESEFLYSSCNGEI